VKKLTENLDDEVDAYSKWEKLQKRVGRSHFDISSIYENGTTESFFSPNTTDFDTPMRTVVLAQQSSGSRSDYDDKEEEGFPNSVRISELRYNSGKKSEKKLAI